MFLEDVSELSRCSNKKVSVVCDFMLSESCLVKVIRKYYDIQNNTNRNNGMYSCWPCSRMRQRGRNAPNCRYKELDDHLTDIINSEEKAYLIGWIASDGWLDKNGTVGISVNIRDVDVLEVLRDFICPDLPISDEKQGAMKKLSIHSTQWCESIQKHLNLHFEKGGSYKKSHLVQMPVGISDSLKWCFLRGYFEGDGSIFIAKRSRGSADGLCVNISSCSLAMRLMIVTFCRLSNINISMYQNQVQLHGQYAARFLEKIYAGCNEKFVLKRKYDIYKKLKTELSRFWDKAAIAEEAYLTVCMKDLTIT